MKRGTKILVAIAGIAATLGLSGCSDSWTWHQKLTVTVETPNGEVSGASVIEVTKILNESTLTPPEARGLSTRVRGEAVVADLGGGRFLFTLLGSAGDMAMRVFPEQLAGRETAEWVAALAELRASRPLPRKHYPLMVTFGDIADPKTVKRVDPDDLAATFGPGTRLQSVTLEITDEPVTEGKVEQVLGWLRDVWPNRLDGDRFGNFYSQNRFANSLSANSFSTEIRK